MTTRSPETIQRAEVEDIYELAPAQAGMLFHTLGSPESGVYVQQLWWTLEGDVDPRALVRAWDRVAARHAVLRTSFHWEGLERPYQVVHRTVGTPLVDAALSHLAPAAPAASVVDPGLAAVAEDAQDLVARDPRRAVLSDHRNVEPLDRRLHVLSPCPRPRHRRRQSRHRNVACSQ